MESVHRRATRKSWEPKSSWTHPGMLQHNNETIPNEIKWHTLRIQTEMPSNEEASIPKDHGARFKIKLGGPALSRATGRAGKICIGARARPRRPNFPIFELQRKFGFCVENFEISVSWNRTLFQPSAFVTNSFAI